jgi:hypothetical protein
MLRLISYKSLLELGSWPTSHCLRDVVPEKRDQYFFISHPWLSKDHPDPNNLKWQMLADWWSRLDSLKDEFSGIDPSQLTWESLSYWLERRREVAPIISKLHGNTDKMEWVGLYKGIYIDFTVLTYTPPLSRF